MLNCFSCVQLCAILWTETHQAPLSMDSSGKNTGVGCYALLQGIFLTQGPNSCLLLSPALASRFLTTSATWEAQAQSYYKSFTWQASWGKAAISTPDSVHSLYPRVSERRYSQGLRSSSPLAGHALIRNCIPDPGSPSWRLSHAKTSFLPCGWWVDLQDIFFLLLALPPFFHPGP